MAALAPLALHLLGVETPSRRRNGGQRADGGGMDGHMDARPTRSSRRPTSYFNPFLTTCTTATDDPPCYAIATQKRVPVQRRHTDGGRETLPEYTCTVAAEGKVLSNIEYCNPLDEVSACGFREVYLILRGTMLNVHKCKGDGPGTLLRSYTLQHAEIGLAPDVEHHTLEPKTKLAKMIPTGARRRAYIRDPALFDVVYHYAMRLRLEADQIIFTSPSEDQIHDLIHAISAGMDISFDIDERSIPKQCTVPRRRRRHRQPQQQQQQQDVNLEDPTFLAEQERILQQMYPSFAGEDGTAPPRLELGHTITTITAASTPALTVRDPPPTPPAREEDDLDISMLREDSALSSPPASPTRPSYLRTTTSLSAITTLSLITPLDTSTSSSPENFSAQTGKWQPPHTRTPDQIRRYIKRCLPVLLADAPRASEILIANSGGRRVRLNARMEMLEAWELSPPSYKSHGFAKQSEVHDDDVIVVGGRRGRPASLSQSSAGGARPSRGTGAEDEELPITPVVAVGEVSESALGVLPELAKVTSSSAEKPTRVQSSRGGKAGRERRGVVAAVPEVGVPAVFCF